ncbi:hypothetical protein BJX96DRAFT_153061 [Aspergillus floccosus]
MSDLGFTTDEHRGNVGLTRVTEAMVNILPGQIGESIFLVKPQERHNYMGELVKSRVPYPCDFISWASQKGLLLEVEYPDEQTLMKPPVDRMIRKLALSVTTEPLSRIGLTSTSLWRAATQVLTWPFSRKEVCAHDDTVSDADFLGNINAPEGRTNPLEALNNEWAAPPDTANEPWHDDHFEPREPSVDETALDADFSGPFEIPLQLESVVNKPETAVVEIENSGSKDEDMSRWAGEGSPDWATTVEETTGDASR